MDPRWKSVDDYIGETLLGSDDALEHALRASEEAGLPSQQVSPAQGMFLQLIALACGARKILEIGTLGGFSTIWLARALPADGRLVTLEAIPRHAEVARANLAFAGLGSLVEIRCGLALDLLPGVAADGLPPFDLVFIDADKVSSADYFAWAVEHTREGGIIITDNVVRDGALADRATVEPAVLGAQRLHVAIAADRRVTATTLQTVGCKGYDGFTFALVRQR